MVADAFVRQEMCLVIELFEAGTGETEPTLDAAGTLRIRERPQELSGAIDVFSREELLRPERERFEVVELELDRCDIARHRQ